jgi:glycosyltransferase involved in cell wall biosynthesis
VKIALALHQYPPYGNGGTEQLAGWTRDVLARSGHTVRIVAAIPRRTAMRRDPPSNPDAGVSFLDAPPPRTTSDSVRSEYHDKSMGAAFGDFLESFRPDVVHFFHLAGLTAAAGGPDRNCVRHLLRLRHPSLRGLEHAELLDPCLKAGFALASHVPVLAESLAAPYEALLVRTPAIRQALARATALIAPTEHVRERLVGLGLSPHKLRVVLYGIPKPTRAAAAERVVSRSSNPVLRLAFVGTLAYHKGPHLLPEALQHIPHAPLHVQIYGDGDEGDYRDALLRASRADARIELRGSIPADRLPALLSDIDVLVVPSLWFENAPLVALQAVAHRCPLLAANVPGLRECVSERDGWFFERGDSRDLAARILAIVGTPGQLSAIRGSRVSVRTVDDWCADLVALYDSRATSREALA